MKGALLLLSLVACAPPPPVEHARDLKVMTINLRNNADWWEERVPLLADEIARLQPDLVGLQEVQINADQGLMIQAELSAQGLEYGYDDRLKVGIAEFLGEGIGAFYRGTQVERDSLPLTEGRVALRDRVDLGEGLIVDLIDTHLEAGAGSTGDGDELRRAQAEAIVEWAGESDGIRFLTGDMNATPEKPAIAEYVEAGWVDSWPAVHGEDVGATSPVVLAKEPVEQSFTRRIDYVFAQNATPKESIICFDMPRDDGLFPSDHLGVMSTFSVAWLEE